MAALKSPREMREEGGGGHSDLIFQSKGISKTFGRSNFRTKFCPKVYLSKMW